MEFVGTNSFALEPNKLIEAFGERFMKTIKKELGEDQEPKIFFQEMLAGDTMVLLAGSLCVERIMPAGSLHEGGKPESDSAVRKESHSL